MGETGSTEESKLIKPPKTFAEQVDILKRRNLIISNEQRAIEVLKRINYYRLSAYFLSLKQEGTDLFIDGTAFDKIYRIYEFDVKLRNLLLEQLERIEIAFRTHIAYLLGHKYDALGYMQGEHFLNEERHTEFLAELVKELGRKKRELFVTHHFDHYAGKFPVWVAIEVISFGTLSKLYSNLKIKDKKEIAKLYYKVPYLFLENWLMILAYIRNVCAHFARIYNKSLVKKPKLGEKDKLELGNDKIFAPIFVMKKLAGSQVEWKTFVTKLESLIEEYKDEIELHRIGFPVNWSDLLIQSAK